MRVFSVDHRILAGTVILVSSGVAIYSTYKLQCLRAQKGIVVSASDSGSGSASGSVVDNVYETQKSLNEYLLFHYGTKDETLRFHFAPQNSIDFMQRCTELCLKYYKHQPGLPDRALDIGCAVGRSAFELCCTFSEVIGIDYSKLFIDTCNLLKDHGHLKYAIPIEGELIQQLDAKVNPELDRQRAAFITGDACSLPLDIGLFGCVLAANLIDRLHSPTDFLGRLASLVAPGGVLVITSPYTFLREYTPRDRWIGGFNSEKTGEPFSGFDGLQKNLAPHFDLLEKADMPFMIRETGRKHQWTVAHATAWRRKL